MTTTTRGKDWDSESNDGTYQHGTLEAVLVLVKRHQAWVLALALQVKEAEREREKRSS